MKRAVKNSVMMPKTPGFSGDAEMDAEVNITHGAPRIFRRGSLPKAGY